MAGSNGHSMSGGSCGPASNNIGHEIVDINVTDGMFASNGTTSVPKSVLRYVVDNVKLFVPI